MKNIRIYDNGGETYDRYTVVFINRAYSRGNPSLRDALAMSADPFHPCGIGQHTGALPGIHLGLPIDFEELPVPCQRLVKCNL